jgi:hypothetical protein
MLAFTRRPRPVNFRCRSSGTKHPRLAARPATVIVLASRDSPVQNWRNTVVTAFFRRWAVPTPSLRIFLPPSSQWWQSLYRKRHVLFYDFIAESRLDAYHVGGASQARERQGHTPVPAALSHHGQGDQ